MYISNIDKWREAFFWWRYEFFIDNANIVDGNDDVTIDFILETLKNHYPFEAVNTDVHKNLFGTYRYKKDTNGYEYTVRIVYDYKQIIGINRIKLLFFDVMGRRDKQDFFARFTGQNGNIKCPICNKHTCKLEIKETPGNAYLSAHCDSCKRGANEQVIREETLKSYGPSS